MSSSEAGESDGLPTLIARYGQLLGEDHPEQVRAGLMLGIVSDLLASGAQVRSSTALVGTLPTIGVRLGDMKLLVGLVWGAAPLTAQEVGSWRRAAGTRNQLQVVLISMAGFDDQAGAETDPQGSPVILVDRRHVEAALCGLLTIEEAVREIGDRALFDGNALSSVTDLLLTTVGGQNAPQFVSFTRLPMPWDLEIAAADGVLLQHLLSGGVGWGAISGFSVDGPRLLLTTDDGIVEVDALRGTAHWLVPLAGCTGNVLVAADGGILIRRGPAVVEWKDGILTPIAGDLDDARTLLWGPEGKAWALCGNGAHLGGATLGLVRLGGTVGDQQRHSVSFNANVLAAAWLDGLRFFLTADGSSAVLDLARTTLVRRNEWIQSPPSPRLAATLNGDVITAGADPTGVRASLYRLRPTARTYSLIADVQLNKVQGLGVTSDGRLLLLGDVRGNDVFVPRPVIVEVTLPDQARTVPPTDGSAQPREIDARAPSDLVDGSSDSDSGLVAESAARTVPYDAVLLAAHGERKDYRLQHRPLNTGGQADVFQGVHKRTGTAIALKRLRMTGEDHRSRLKREVDAGHMFGQNPHVMPVLDCSPTNDWLVMPLADHSAEDKAATLRDNALLRELITAICDGLREPHQYGWIHRDLKPANILWLAGRWVVADWGLGRRPHGQTTTPGRTVAGEFLGTLGYAAPELYSDAHRVTPQTDIFSMGQMIGWALLQTEPRANVPHLPASGPWRAVVEAATQQDPQQRPATVDELLSLIAAQLDVS